MQAEYRGLGFDPAPGSVSAVVAAAERCAAAAAAVETAGLELESAAGMLREWWRGEAAAGFDGQVGGAPGELSRAREALRIAASVLDEWAATLRSNQRAAEELDRRALLLRARLEAASSALEDARAALDVTLGSGVRAAQATFTAATSRHVELRRELDEVLRQAHELRGEHHAAADEAARRLRAVAGGAVPVTARPEEPFAPLARRLNDFSRHTATLAVTLLGPASPIGSPVGGGPAHSGSHGGAAHSGTAHSGTAHSGTAHSGTAHGSGSYGGAAHGGGAEGSDAEAAPRGGAGVFAAAMNGR